MAKKQTKNTRGKKTEAEKPPAVAMHGSVLQTIRRHARSSPQIEICGVLLGTRVNGQTRVVGAIRGEGATQGDAHVTFTQETWVKIHQEKDARYPDEAIVGWYHSHPGFGVFLSDHDLFIHKNFFSEPGQLAWVFDPHSDEEGCFGWDNNEVRRVKQIEVVSDVDHEPLDRTEPAIVPEKSEDASHQTQTVSVFKEFGRDLMLIGAGSLLGVVMAFMWFSGSQTVSGYQILKGLESLGYVNALTPDGRPVWIKPIPNDPILKSQQTNTLKDRPMNPSGNETPLTADDDSTQTGGRDEQPEPKNPDHLE